MALDTTSRRTRRSLLAAAGAAAAALTAGALRGLPTARAGVDGDVVLGAANSETAPTSITNSTDDSDALAATAAGSGIGIAGHANGGNGVQGTNLSLITPAVLGHNGGEGTGVQGFASGYGFAVPDGKLRTGVLGVGGTVVGTPARGVHGFSGSGAAPDAPDSSIGVFGQAEDDIGTGMWGRGAATATSNSLGVLGEGDTGVLGAGTFGVVGSAGRPGIGVYGSASASALPAVYGKTGVVGQSDLGGTAIVGFTGVTATQPPPDTGIYGRSNTGGTNGRGLTGFCAAGIGLLGQTNTGVGVRAFSGTNTGVALRVTGKAAFDRSGKLTITAGHSSITKTGIALTSASFILATLQTNVSGLAIQAAVVNVAGSSFTISINKAPAVNVAVAWMAVN
jgi:hypothetical protein